MPVSGKAKLVLTLSFAPTESGSHPAGIGAITQDLDRAFTATSGFNAQEITSTGAFVALGGVSAAIGPVKAATVLYLYTSARCDIRITQLTEGGGTTTRVIESSKGLLIIEVDATEAITLVEVQGALPSGAVTVEWFACGT